jgi:hypothetical protein
MAEAGITPETDPACIADWDAVSYSSEDPPCLRRLDRTLKYTGEITSAIHRNGQIWSHALWNLRTAIGHAHADTAILWAQFDWTGTTMPELAQRIVDEVEDRYGAAEAALAEAAFEDRDILP